MATYSCKTTIYDTNNYPVIKVKILPVKPSRENVKESLSLITKVIENTSGPFVMHYRFH